MSTAQAKSTLVGLALIAAAVVLALAAASGRKRLIRSFFVDGPAAVDMAEFEGRGGTGHATDVAAPLRVVLIDGLGARSASELPVLNEFCRDGIDLRVDVGFPTVSLPVQHVLWTGLSQQQSGIWYRIAPLEQPPAASLPARTVDSVAVAESHPEIVHSFGFSSAQPATDVFADADSDSARAWRAEGFEAAATAAVGSASPLVFVHILRVDEAGHAHGAASPQYERAARAADALLGRLLAADGVAQQAQPGAWLVVSDHGHRPGGGHAGPEDSIRIVRACLGDGPLASSLRSVDGGAIHLVDLSRAVADSLGLAPHVESLGRPLDEAVLDPLDTVPKVGTGRLVLAALLAGVGLAIGLVVPRGWDRLMGLMPLLAIASARTMLGPITLSLPAIYPPMGSDLIAAIAPVLVLSAVFDLVRPEDDGRRLVALVAGPAGLALAALVACGGLTALIGQASAPPLMPHFTAVASVALAATVAGSALAAALLLTRLVVARLAGRPARAWASARRPAPSSASREAGSERA